MSVNGRREGHLERRTAVKALELRGDRACVSQLLRQGRGRERRTTTSLPWSSYTNTSLSSPSVSMSCGASSGTRRGSIPCIVDVQEGEQEVARCHGEGVPLHPQGRQGEIR